MKRLLLWIVVIVVILLLFPGILPAIDRWAERIDLKIPNLQQSWEKIKNPIEDGIEDAKDKVDEFGSDIQEGIANVKDKVNDVPKVDTSGKTTSEKHYSKEELDELLSRVEIKEADESVKYDRNQWEKPKKTFKIDGKSKSIRDYAAYSSRWLKDWNNFKYLDPYTNKVETNLSKLDWDHLVPLAYVHQHGGSLWSNDKKNSYAFSLSVGVDTYQSENRKKGARGPSEYLPPANQSAYCTTWFFISDVWDISMNQDDFDVCKDIVYKDINGAYLLID